MLLCWGCTKFSFHSRTLNCNKLSAVYHVSVHKCWLMCILGILDIFLLMSLSLWTTTIKMGTQCRTGLFNSRFYLSSAHLVTTKHKCESDLKTETVLELMARLDKYNLERWLNSVTDFGFLFRDWLSAGGSLHEQGLAQGFFSRRIFFLPLLGLAICLRS